MCVRRFLILIFILILIFVGGAFALYQFGGQVLIRQAIPRGHFQAAGAGQAPDYSSPGAWISRPGINDDPSRWQPEREAPYDLHPGVQTFYVHPTTYLERDHWNAPLRPGGETEFRTRLFVQSQASVFHSVGEVWAPRYRQAAYGAFLLNRGDAQKALDLAYGDIVSAFDEFVRQSGNGPIILAGHSQGALHLLRLLKEKVAGKPIAKRVVAAYVVGWPISTAVDLPALGLAACKLPEQRGCILSWLTFGDPPNPDLLLTEWSKTKGLDGGVRRQQDLLCVNPITGTMNGVDRTGVSGTLVPTADLRSATISYDALGAHCAQGLLIIDGQLPPLGPYVLPGNNYHVYDFALFWGAIRRDVLRRVGE
jgi:hypothetical protein